MKARGIQMGFFVGVLAIGLALHQWAGAQAQGVTQVPSGSIAELISEVKLMRVALQEMANGQSQMQALGIQLTAQQSRIAQISASLDAATAQLSEVSNRGKEAARELSSAQALFGRSPDPNQRATLQVQIADLKQLSAEIASEEAQLKSRVSRLTSTLNAEEQRWQQLSSRLDSITRPR